jgi:hypothetical protein
MKLLIILIISVSGTTSVCGQSSTVRSQGGNTGYGGAYVAPVTTKTYTPKPAPYTPYTAPAKTYNYNSNSPSGSGNTRNSKSSSSPSSGGSGGSYSSAEVGYKTSDRTEDDIAIQQAIKDKDWDAVFQLADKPAYLFNQNATGGGGLFIAWIRTRIALQEEPDKNKIYPLAYKAVYIKKMGSAMPAFLDLPDFLDVNINSEGCLLTNACIYEGDFGQALKNLQQHPYYGKQKVPVKKKHEEYEAHEQMRNYINYMAGCCFRELGKGEESRNYLSIGTGIAAWDKIYTDGAAYRAAKVANVPANIDRAGKPITKPMVDGAPVPEVTKPVVAVAPGIADAGKPAAITDPTKLYSTYTWTEKAIAGLAGLVGQAKVADVMKLSNEAAWPRGIASFATRMENGQHFATYKTHYKGNIADDLALLYVSAGENGHMASDLKPGTDIYFIVLLTGISIR